MRQQKTLEQVAAIEEAQRAAEAAMGAVIAYLQSSANPTSEEAHALIDKVIQQHGCESPEGHIVAGGVQGAEPHEEGSGPLRAGEPIVIDIYPRNRATGYFGDLSRTVCIGEPAVQVQAMYSAVLKAQELAISMVRPGVKCIDIQTAVEKVFADAGFETSGQGRVFAFAEGFVHGVGHGVGKDIHEPPRIGQGSLDVLAKDDVITIEPGLYYKSLGGIRIEDLLEVTAKGSRNLTTFPKEFRV